MPGYVRPQDKINEDLDKCDYFIGVLWNNWGSRPTTDPDGPTSGFEEEYKRAETRIRDGFMKDMAIYFKAVEVPAGLEPGEGLRKVLDFRKNCINEKKPFFKDFIDSHGFREIVRDKLEEIGWRETEITSGETQPANQSKNAPSSQAKSDDAPPRDAWLLDEDTRNFLSDLAQRSSDWERTSRYDVARLRLIGTALNRAGNDDFYVGNHDANLIYQQFRNARLSEQEIRALVDCGIVGFQHQNVPLWRWLVRDESKDGPWGRVKVLAGLGTDDEKKQAIDILGLLCEKIPSLDEFFDKKRVLSIWLSDETESQVFDTAVSFLSTNADVDDLALIEEAATQCSPYRRTKIEEAIVGILSRVDLQAALKRIVEKEVDKIDVSLAEALFGSPQSLATETIFSCLSAKPELIRLQAVQLLFERDEIALETAETLLTDSNHEIRLLAAENLTKRGVVLKDDVARKALLIVRPSNGLVSGIARTETDDTYYERYRANRLGELGFENLKDTAESAGVINYRELSVLFSKYSRKTQGVIRNNLKDCFHSYFDIKIQEAKKSEDISDETERDLRDLEKYLLKKICNAAVISLTKLGNSRDLDLIRKVLGEVEIDADEAILKYLGRFGNWSDIERVKKLGNHPSSRTGLLGLYKTKFPEQKAAAILALGKSRVADMLALELDSKIRVALAKQLPKKVLLALRDEVLLRELERQGDEYRIVFALRCVQTLPRARVTGLLDRHVDGSGHRFYNSVHWLDLGAALPANLAKRIAERALTRH